MSLYDLRRSAGAKLLAEMPATMVAIPPPSHRVKPRTCTSSQNPRIEGPCDLLTVHDFRNRLPAGISGFELMPMLDPVFPGLPAPEDISPLELAVEIDQSLMRLRNCTCSADSPDSGFACATRSSYWDTRSRHWGWRDRMSDTTRLTRGSVRLASASVKYLRGTGTIYEEMQQLLPFLLPHNDNTVYELRMGDEPYYPFIAVHDYDRRADVRIARIQPLDPVAHQLRVGRDVGRVVPGVGLRRAFRRVVPGGDALRHDVAVRNRAQKAPVLGVIHHGHDRDVLGAHQQRHLGAGGAGGGDERLAAHDFAGEHRSNVSAQSPLGRIVARLQVSLPFPHRKRRLPLRH